MLFRSYVGDERLTKFGVRFTQQVWPGDDLQAAATFTGFDEDDASLANFEVITTNQNGDVVLKGRAQARVDR